MAQTDEIMPAAALGQLDLSYTLQWIASIPRDSPLQYPIDMIEALLETTGMQEYYPISWLAYLAACGAFGLTMSLTPYRWTWAKHAMSICIGIVWSEWLIGPSWIIPVLTSLGVWLVLQGMRWAAPLNAANPARARWWSRIAIACSLCFQVAVLAVLHVSPGSVPGVEMTYATTLCQMDLLKRLWSLTFQVYDGCTPRRLELEDTMKTSDQGSKRHLVAKGMLERATVAFPSFVEFMSYAVNPLAMGNAPYQPIQWYLDAISGRQWEHLPTKPCVWNRLAGAVRCLVTGALYTAVHAAWMYHMPRGFFEGDIGPEPAPVSQILRINWWWYVGGFLDTQLGLTHFWKLSEGVAILAGFGWNPDPDSEFDWNRLETTLQLTVMFRVNIQTLLRQWNVRVHEWILWNVYYRLPRWNKLHLIGTRVLVGLWHGVGAGYLAFFISSICLSLAEAEVLRLAHHRFFRENEPSFPWAARTAHHRIKDIAMAYNLLRWINLITTISYGIAGYRVHSWDECYRIFNATYWQGYWSQFVIIAMLWAGEYLGLLWEEGKQPSSGVMEQKKRNGPHELPDTST